MKQTLKLSWVLIILLAITAISSCKKDKDEETLEVLAGFSYVQDATNPLLVQFTNTSKNFTSLSWNFGDESALSTETNPSHTFPAAGTYIVTLTATGASGTDHVSQNVVLVDANAQLTILTGGAGDGKTWKLLRDVSTHRYPLECGPDDRSSIWWAMGLNNTELTIRPCMLNDEWLFKNDGAMVFDAKGDFWAEGGVYDTLFDNTCHSTDDMIGVDGDNLSAWGSGTHTFDIADGKLTVTGLGAYLGLSKVATDAEVKLPQDYVTYDVIKLTEGTTDTLIVETSYMAGTTPAYWRFVLVHYDDPNDEPPLEAPKPIPGYSMSVNGLTVTFTNTTTDADSYSWDFGDGQTSTENNPVHTYATEGVYDVILSATNVNGTAQLRNTLIMLTNGTITADQIAGNPWKIRVGAKSVFVGPLLGAADWWALPLNFLDGSSTGVDDWSCMADDEFIFTVGGLYEYRTNGSARNDGYMGTPNGCWSDAEIAASGNGAAFGSAIHAYSVIPTGPWGRSNIVLTNGSTGAAFVGFYKGYYGGENTDNSVAPNGGLTTNTYEVMGYTNTGTKEYLFLSVDLTAAHTGENSWSVILER